MNELRIAAVHLARAWSVGGVVHVVGDDQVVPAPFLAVPVADAEAVLRARARPGDAVVVLDERAGRDRILRRCPAWGAAAIWLGAGRRPGDGLATVCVEGEAETLLAALHAQAMGLRGDVLALAPAVQDCTDEVCVTCSDEGRTGEVVDPPAEPFAPARVRTATGVEDVDVTIVGAVAPDDLLVIHAGTAIARVDEPAERLEAVR